MTQSHGSKVFLYYDSRLPPVFSAIVLSFFILQRGAHMKNNKILKLIVAVLAIAVVLTVVYDMVDFGGSSSDSPSSKVPYSITNISAVPNNVSFDVTTPNYAKNKYVYNTLAQLKKSAKKLSAGTKVATLGYYSKYDNGAANYIISSESSLVPNEATVIRLGDGLFAVLETPGNAVFVEQLGAHGDGVHDDTAIINLALNSGFKNVLFSNTTYKCTSEIIMNQPGVNVYGNNAILKTDNDYAGTKEWFFIVQSDEIYINCLNIKSFETIATPCTHQLCIMNASDVLVNNCTFEYPDSVCTVKNDGSSLGHTNIDLYTNWHNIEITDCMLVNNSGGEKGGGIWIRDLLKQGCSNLKFTGNTLYKRCHDEILAIYLGSIEEVEISGNSFTTEETGNFTPSPFNFCFGQANSILCKNIVFDNNDLNTESTSFIAAFGNCENVKFTNNRIQHRQIGEKNLSLFSYLDNSTVKDVLFDGNVIDVNAIKILNMVFRLDCSIGNNTITSNYKVNRFMADSCTDLGSNTFNNSAAAVTK